MPFENATTIDELNPDYPLGSDPIGEGDNHIRMIKQVLKNSSASGVREVLRHNYANAGFIMVAGSFEQGGTVNTLQEVLLHQATGQAYQYRGILPKTMPAGSTPVGDPLWVSQANVFLTIGSYHYYANGVDDSNGLAQAQNVAIAATLPLEIVGVAKVTTPVTLTVPLVDSLRQIFTMDSNITINNPATKVRPEMFGDVEGALDKCVQVLPVFGGSIYLEEARYKTSRYEYGFAGAGKFIGKDNISIVGKRRPDGNPSLTQLENGSIIEGALLVWANNPTLSDLGVDCGKAVVDAHYGGVVAPGITEGLFMTYPNDAVKNSGVSKKGARLHNVCGLAYSPVAQVHAMILAEGYVDTICTGLMHGMMGVHGVVIKADHVTAESILSECNAGEGMVIKSDNQLTATSSNVFIKDLQVSRLGFNRTAHTAPPTAGTIGLQILSTGANGVDGVRIGHFRSVGHAFGIRPSKSNFSDIINVEIGTASIELLGATGSTLGVYYPENTSTLLDMHIGQLDVRNGQQAISLGDSKNLIKVDSLDVKNLSDCFVDLQHNCDVTIDTVTYKDFTGSGKWRINTGGVLKVGTTTAHNVEAPEFASGGVAVVLNPGHTAPVQAVTARLLNYGLELNGLVKSPSVTSCINLPAGLRPKQVIRRATTVASSPSSFSPGLLTIGTDGSVVVNEAFGATPAEWGSIAIHFAF